MPKRSQACHHCGHDGIVVFGDRALAPGELVAFYSFSCSCGARSEADDVGRLEGEWRKQELREGGRWRLSADTNQHAKCARLRRPFMQVTAIEALQALREGLTGTHEEMRCCAPVLWAAGLHADVVCVEEGVGEVSEPH